MFIPALSFTLQVLTMFSCIFLNYKLSYLIYAPRHQVWAKVLSSSQKPELSKEDSSWPMKFENPPKHKDWAQSPHLTKTSRSG